MSDVTVVMPARNAAKTIERALRSVLSAKETLEVIVIDDGSSDETAATARSLEDPRVKIIPGPCKGVAAALNQGFEIARGAYIARCDADDWWQEDRLGWQRLWLELHPDYIAVSAGFATATESGDHVADLATGVKPRDDTERLLNGETTTSFCTWLTRRDNLIEIGGARSWFETSSDLDLQFRLAGTGRVWHEPRVCYHYVLHDLSITHSQATGLREFFEHHARAFAKQRRETGTDPLMQGKPPVYQASQDRKEKAPGDWRRQVSGQLTGKAWRHADQGEYGAAIRQMLRAIRHTPVRAVTWLNFGKILIKAVLRR